ncbi:helix-hairpin-helix domain-containing protein [Proteiniphilum sp. UBA1028]|uniref:helix-hairpin-helix domain-containing protein n=1 Tax=Proteiniphilum sp. UBA1028 TaxID=1947251 RepID=UPI000E9862EB|nr:helix-hairpin-helix domain-containing protein [Proteiniphilum sp. UBA1028]HBG58953.1 hypothetical protein [Porphyromonadaceae bacterium]
MKWKDFLHYQQGSKLAVILLLVLILLTMILNGVLRYGRRSEMVIVQNEALINEFDSFRQTLKERVPPYREARTYEEMVEYEPESLKPVRNKETLENDDHERLFTTYPGATKLSAGETISLNDTDTAQWKKIPGIGSTFASRIVKYGDLLGGYVMPEQLLEVYGMDMELYGRILPYIQIGGNWKRVKVNELHFRELLRHPYLNYTQVQAIINLRRRKGDIASINELAMLNEFTSEDISRLAPYLEF